MADVYQHIWVNTCVVKDGDGRGGGEHRKIRII